MSEKMRGPSLRRRILPGLVAGLGLLASGCANPNSEPQPGPHLLGHHGGVTTVDQDARRVNLGDGSVVQCFGGVAVFFGFSGSAAMPPNASKWICQGPDGKLPPEEEITEFLQTGHIPEQPQG